MKKNRFQITQILYQEMRDRIRVKQSQNWVKQSWVWVKQSWNWGKTEPELGCEIGLQEEAKPTLVERFKEEWTEVVLLRNMTHREVISFVQEHMICRFGVPQTLTTDQGTSFMSHQFREFMESMKIKLLNSSPYYAQANVQAEAINKVLMRIIKKRIKDN
jgi:IS30 family transposase